MNKKPFQKQLLLVILIFSLLAIALSACGTEGASTEAILDGGPKTWIEYPPEGEIFSMGAIPIVVYASSASGVTSIEIDVNGQALPAGQLSSLAGGSPTLVSTEVLWQPPTEGKYVIYASSGNGAPTVLTFCVANCDTPSTEIATLPPIPTETLPVITLPPESTLTPVPTNPPPTNPPPTNPPPTNPPPTNPPPTNPPPTNPPPTNPPPPADTTGPDISGAYLSWNGCEFYGSATITDPSGVSWAKFNYNKNGEGWNSIWMSGSTSEIGVSVDDFSTPLGTIEYYFTASDNLNNESEGGFSSYNYDGCGG